MQKNLLALLFLLFTTVLGVNAQEHMKFMGIPIDGTLSSFGTKLSEKGFVKKNADDGILSFKGKFTGKDVDVLLLGTEETLTVWKVVVLFDKETSWSSIKSIFNDYKDMFKGKYGEPSNDFHFFSKPYYEGDGYEMQALRMDKCTYSTFWNTLQGSINLDMNKRGYITIAYEDKANSVIWQKEKEERDLNDI